MKARALTKGDLIAACAMAESAMNGPIQTPWGQREYHQAHWDCGTACCIHGFAASAAGRPLSSHMADNMPLEDDYEDCRVAAQALHNAEAEPATVRWLAQFGNDFEAADDDFRDCAGDFSEGQRQVIEDAISESIG